MDPGNHKHDASKFQPQGKTLDHELEIVEAFPATLCQCWGSGDGSKHHSSFWVGTVRQGMKIDRGYISPYFITDTKAGSGRSIDLIGWVALLRSGMLDVSPCVHAK